MFEQKYGTQIYLNEEQYRFLKEQSARYGISMAGKDFPKLHKVLTIIKVSGVRS
jgi:hypothetical protein